MNEYIKVFGLQSSGNGVYITKDLRLVVVHGGGYMTDWVVVYDYDQPHFAMDFPELHSKTTKEILIPRSIRYLKSLKDHAKWDA